MDIESINTFRKGKKAFENIYFHENGKISLYEFLDDNCENCFYKKEYDEDGKVISVNGELFFQGYLDKINPKTLEVKNDGKRMHISIFHPTIPYCENNLYVKLDTVKAKVFSSNKYISFLEDVYVDTDKHEKEWTEIDVWFEVICEEDTLLYHNPIYYKVID